MTQHWSGVRSGWNERGKSDSVWQQIDYASLQDRKRKKEEFEQLGLQALDLLGSANYLRLVDQMPDRTTLAEAIEWMQEIVKAGDLLQGYCRHTRMETDENYSRRLVGGDLIEYESMTVYCPDCGRSLLCMNLA